MYLDGNWIGHIVIILWLTDAHFCIFWRMEYIMRRFYYFNDTLKYYYITMYIYHKYKYIIMTAKNFSVIFIMAYKSIKIKVICKLFFLFYFINSICLLTAQQNNVSYRHISILNQAILTRHAASCWCLIGINILVTSNATTIQENLCSIVLGSECRDIFLGIWM